MKVISETINTILRSAPILIVILAYFIRLERILARIMNDLDWLKKLQKPCQPTLEDDTT